VIGQVALLTSLAGGALIGLAVAVLLLIEGRVAGISGIVAGLVQPAPGEWGWRALFVAGLLAGGIVARALDAGTLGAIDVPLPVLALAGALVGFGTRLSGGCTSGHGVCGISRAAPRSLAATATFMCAAGVVVLLVRHGGSW
jgi:uncharacterized membrane protein YedE/YeeE